MAVSIAIAVVRQDLQYLIGRRPEGVPLAGYWEFPGGKVQPGEAAARAAERECREETGLAVTASSHLLTHVHQYEHARVQLEFFLCQLNHKDQQPWLPFRWVPHDQLSRYRFPPGNDQLLQLLAAEERKRDRLAETASDEPAGDAP